MEGSLYILAPYVATPQDVVERMLELAKVTCHDVVYDLGCGDGRMLITAASKYGARGVGVDIEPYRVEESQANARAAGVDHLVTFSLEDALNVDLWPATVVSLYLVQWSTEMVQPVIAGKVKPGTRVVSHQYNLDGWSPVTVEEFVDAAGRSRPLYLWVANHKAS